MIDSAHRSREALQVDTIDLLQLHVWDDTWVRAPAFAATVGHLKDSGLIRHFGLSLNDWEPANARGHPHRSRRYRAGGLQHL